MEWSEIMGEEELLLLPEELEEAWESIKQPFGGLFGNTVFTRVLREIIADPYREFRPKDLEILTSASPPMIGEALKKLGNYSAPNNQHRQTQLMRCRVASSRELTSSNFVNRYRFPF